MKSFRTVWQAMIPANFGQGEGEIIQWLEGWFLDAFIERTTQVANLMLPSRCVSDALDKIGSDRGIPRGFSEPEASYRLRLKRWRYPRGHRVRGNAPGLLEQIAAVFGDAVTAQTIDARGTRYTWGANGATTTDRGVSWNWDGSSLTPEWARFWVVLKVAGATLHKSFDDGAWGPTVDADEDVCLAGRGIHPGQLAAIRQLTRVGRLSWTPAGRRSVYLVVWFEGDAYPAPNGTWDEWGNRPPQTYAFEPLHPLFT